jgi:ATP-binding cassette subfamily B protein
MIVKYLGRREWALFALSVVFIVAQVYLDLRIPEYMSDITLALENGESSDVIVKSGVGMVSCALLSLGASLCAGYLIATISTSLSRKLRLMLLDQVQSFSPEEVERFSVASLVTRSTNDVTQIQMFVGRALQVTVKSPIMAVWAIYKISSSSWEWTVATAVGVIVLFSVMLVVIWLSMRHYRRIQELTDSINREARDGINGVRVIRAYNAEAFQNQRFDETSEELLDRNMAVLRIMFPMFTMTSAITNFLTLAIYWIGASLISAAGETETQMVLFSDMIVFSSYAIQVLRAFMLVSEIIRMYPRASVSMRRVMEVIGCEPRRSEGAEAGGERSGEVEFRHVCFSYPGAGREALHDVSFKVGRGQTLAIIGPSGSGKSTIAKLILRTYDATSGEVLVDGMGVGGYRREALTSRISYVPQESIIFTGTVRDNVNYGDTSGQRDDDDVWKALDVAQASEFIRGMPGGLDAMISQYGKNLSGGQRQRISIARGICRHSGILVLDDPFSALDFKTDRRLRSALKEEMKGATVVMIAQRIGTIMDADVIVVVDEGKVVGVGTHSELMKGCRLYRDIAVSQMTEGTL